MYFLKKVSVNIIKLIFGCGGLLAVFLKLTDKSGFAEAAVLSGIILLRLPI